MTTLAVAGSPSPLLNCELPQNIITSPCRYVEEIVNCRSGHLSAYKPSTNTVQGTSGCVIVSCRVVRVTNSQLRQSCCQISDGEHFAAQLYCVGTFGSPQNFAPTLSLPTPHLRSTTATSDKKCIVHSSHVPLHCYQPNNSKFHPDSYFTSAIISKPTLGCCVLYCTIVRRLAWCLDLIHYFRNIQIHQNLLQACLLYSWCSTSGIVTEPEVTT